MHSFLSSPYLAEVSEYIPFAGMMIPIAIFFFILLIIVASQYLKNQSRKMWHETARIALEKGQPIPCAPSELEEAIGKTPNTPFVKRSGRGDVKSGLILLAVAAGLYFGFNDLRAQDHSVPSVIFYVPGCIGVALLLNALITYLTTKKTPETPSTPPSPKA
jgi:hypothetical protein